ALGRALAKTAADRFATAAEFAAALAEVEPTRREPAAAIPASRASSRRRVLASAAVIAFVALAGFAVVKKPGPLSRWLPGSGTAHAAKKDWILVAEFDGPAADSAVVTATRDLVMAALDQSEIVATVPRDQIRLALQSAGKPPSTRVDGDVAREIAYRSAVRTVLEGRVGRLGKGYSLVLRLVDADTARVVLSVSDAARDEE